MNIRLVSTTLLGAVSGAVVAATAAPHAGVLLWIASALLAGAVCAALAPHDAAAQEAQAADEILNKISANTKAVQTLTASLESGFRELKEAMPGTPDLSALESGVQSLVDRPQPEFPKVEIPAVDLSPVIAGLGEVSSGVQSLVDRPQPEFPKVEIPAVDLSPVIAGLGEVSSGVQSLVDRPQPEFPKVEIPAVDLSPVIAGLGEVSSGVQSLVDRPQPEFPKVEIPAVDLSPVIAGLDAVRESAAEVRPDERAQLLLAELGSKLDVLNEEFVKIGGTLVSQTMALEALREDAQKREAAHVEQMNALEDAVGAIHLDAPAVSQTSGDSHAFTLLAQSLDQLNDSLAAVEPLSEHLTAHGSQLKALSGDLKTAGELLSEIPMKLGDSVQSLEGSLSTLRANQVEFAASVKVFTAAAERMSGKVSESAPDGQMSMDGLEDHKAFLDALGRVLNGFSQSLQVVLAESSQRTQEVLVELCERLDARDGHDV